MDQYDAQRAADPRELAEEVSYRAGRLTPLCTYHTSKSIMDETAHLFLGAELVPLALPLDETEFIHVRSFSFAEVLRMVHDFDPDVALVDEPSPTTVDAGAILVGFLIGGLLLGAVVILLVRPLQRRLVPDAAASDEDLDPSESPA